MSMSPKEQLVIETLPGHAPEVGRWLWALEDARRRTKDALKDLPAAAVDWTPPDGGNSLGTLLYHIAAIEIDWLCADVLEHKCAPEVWDLFPYEVRDGADRLIPVPGLSLDEHLKRLETVRRIVLDAFRGMTVAEFHRPRRFEKYDVTPEWVLHHLLQHEAEHRGEMAVLRARAEQALQIHR